MARPRRITNEQLLAVTRRVVQARGIGITTRNLAREMGISEGVIFQRFGSKEKLMTAALAPPAINAIALVTDAGKGKDAREALQEIAVAIYRTFRVLLPFYTPFIAQSETETGPSWTSRGSPFQLLLDALDQHLKVERHAGRIFTESPYTASYLIVSALHNVALLETVADEPRINEGPIRDLIGIVWMGLEPQRNEKAQSR